MSDPLVPKEVSLENRPCPLGCVVNDEQILVGHDRLHNLPGDYVIVKCRSCGLLRTNPRPTQATMSYYYPDDYGPYLSTKIDVVENKIFALGRLKDTLCRLFFRNNIVVLPKIPPGRLLEVGCASGSFLDYMAKRGWQAFGIEFSTSAAAAARAHGLQVHTGALETTPDPVGLYDLVVGWMVAEHLHEPLVALQKLHQWTRIGGMAVFSVPNSASFEFKLFGRYWYELHLPAHLYHYTPKTIGLLLEKSGWKLERVIHQRTLANFVGSLGYVLMDSRLEIFKRFGCYLQRFPESGGRLYYLLFPLAYFLSLFGQTGRMTIWARRI